MTFVSETETTEKCPACLEQIQDNMNMEVLDVGTISNKLNKLNINPRCWITRLV